MTTVMPAREIGVRAASPVAEQDREMIWVIPTSFPA